MTQPVPYYPEQGVLVRVDECVEVTPDAIRIRKVILDANERMKAHRARARA